jgi:hypothetical protein
MSSEIKTQTPELVTELVADIKKKLGPVDLRELQRGLYRQQRAARLSGYAQAVKKMKAARHRRRVRQDVLARQKVVDTRKSHDGKWLYFELGNGQAVRADRVLLRTVKEGLHGFRKGRRQRPFKNGIIWATVSKEIQKNADRPAVPQTTNFTSTASCTAPTQSAT